MKNWMLTWTGAICLAVVAACADAPEAVNEADPSASVEETAAPAAIDEEATPAEPAADGADQTAASRPRLVAPVRGVAQIGYTKPIVKRGQVGGKDFVITTMQIKNMASGPIAGLKVDDFWYDRSGNPLPSDSYRHARPLQPEEVITVTLETPADPRMNRNQWQFSHANGEIKPTLVPKM